MKKFKISVSQLSQRTTPPYPNDRHYLTANSLTHCTNSSVQFKPRSSLSKSSQQFTLAPLSLSLSITQFPTSPYPNDRHSLTDNSLTQCTNSSVQFKPRSSLSNLSQQIATGYSQYTVCYIPCFNAINSTTLQFHSHMQVSFSNYSTAEFSPRWIQRLYLYFLAFFISLQVRNATNVQGTLSCVYVFFSS